MKKLSMAIFTAAILVLFLATGAMADTCIGNCGQLGANGVVTLSPLGSSQYLYVSTSGGIANNVGGLGGTNGSTFTTSLFSAEAGDDLTFYFNYVTSDGAEYADYAWVRLLDSANAEVAILFTARTNPTVGADTVPGFGMPYITATLDPAATPIIDGAPVWSPLGGSSGECWDTGCGYTGWIKSNYDILADGSYKLEFGVANWDDTAFDSGLAFDGIKVDDVPIPVSVPEPATTTMMLIALGLVGFAGFRKNR
jgi:hypothetical protein